jgi:hypothetical protein
MDDRWTLYQQQHGRMDRQSGLLQCHTLAHIKWFFGVDA